MGAVDIDDEKVMVVWVSFGRSSLEAAAYLKKVRAACDGRLPRVQEFLRWSPFHTILCYFNPGIKVFPFSLSYRPQNFIIKNIGKIAMFHQIIAANANNKDSFSFLANSPI